jgi:cbb3-type cytochrome oxidase subunit 3
VRAIITEGLPGDPGLLLFLLAFVAIFTAVALWQWRPAARAAQDRLALMPFDDPD